MKKIVFFITGLGIGGAENQLFHLCKNLDSTKFLITVVSLSHKTMTATKLEKYGIKVLSLDLKSSKIKGILNLFKFLKNYKADIFIGFLFHGIIIARLFSLIFSPSITISSIRSINLGGFFRKSLLKFTDFLTDYTVVNSNLVKEEVLRLKISKSHKLKVIYNIIDLEEFSMDKPASTSIRNNLQINSNTFIWIAVGRLVDAKDHISMIISFKEYLKYDNNSCLLIIGDGDLKSKITTLINSLSLDNKVFLLGKKYNISEFLSISDAFILTSKWEGQPNCILEALSMKLPIVATDVGGVSEIVINNKTGILVEKENIHSICNGMINLKQNYSNFTNSNIYDDFLKLHDCKSIISSWESLIR